MALLGRTGSPARAEDEKSDSRARAHLIQSALAGDAHAWEQIVERHQTPVFRLAYLMLDDADEADDIAQEVFVRAYKRISSFDITRPLRPWLLGITANLSRNRKRSLGRYWAMLGRYLRGVPENSVTDDFTSHMEGALSLHEAVRQLKTSEQEIIYLRFFLEHSVAETAQALGVAPGTVKSRTSRALAQLRRLIQAEFPDLAPAMHRAHTDGAGQNE